jgi:hypothetical protein
LRRSGLRPAARPQDRIGGLFLKSLAPLL